MKKILLYIVCMFAATITSYGQSEEQAVKDYTSCLTKTEFKWGSFCKGCYQTGKTYRVKFVNNCNENLSVKLAVQENHKRWKTYTRPVLLPNDTISGFACVGTGKYLYWTKKADDNTVALPTDEEINAQFAK